MQKSARNSSKKKLKKETIYHCPGCRKTFHGMYHSPAQFVKRHMEVGAKQCREAIYHCKCCNKSFMDRPSFHAHLTRKNYVCNQHYNLKT